MPHSTLNITHLLDYVQFKKKLLASQALVLVTEVSYIETKPYILDKMTHYEM